jgi:molybdopterin synthase catalytic subunit
MIDDIQIISTPLDTAAAIAFVSNEHAGGVAVFLGTTRAETNAHGQQLIALDYQAYEEMAMQQLRKLAAAARAKWPIIKLALLHRIGRVGLAEPSVVIAVSTPHRGDAFDACRFLIDSLKKDIAIWKKEVWADGTGTWVHEGNDEV